MQTLKKTLQLFGLTLLVLVAGCSPKFTEENQGDYILVKNEEGGTLAYSSNSEVKLLSVDQYAFKDLNKNGTLDAYEDWRLSADERAKDLASKLTLEDIAGLMLYSSHQSIPGSSRGFGSSNYNGKPFPESGRLRAIFPMNKKHF